MENLWYGKCAGLFLSRIFTKKLSFSEVVKPPKTTIVERFSNATRELASEVFHLNPRASVEWRSYMYLKLALEC